MSIREFINRERSVASHYLRKHLKEFSSSIGHNSLILDVGCGNQPYKTFFQFDSYIGLDLTMNGKDVEIIGDVCHLPFRENMADVIICTDVLEHVLNTEKAIMEMNRVLKKDGYLILTSPLIIGIHGQVDYWRFTDQALTHSLKKHAFKILKFKRQGGIFSSLGMLLGNVPDQILRSQTPRNSKKQTSGVFMLLLSMIFIPLAKILLLLDCLDRKRYFTLGYSLLCKKEE